MSENARRKLPNRRMNITVAVTFFETDWILGVGFDTSGRASEVFMDGSKIGSDQEALFTDICVMMSLLLQFGMSSEELADKLGREGTLAPGETDQSPPPASALGIVARRIAEIERTSGDGIRWAYEEAVKRPKAPVMGSGAANA